MLLVACVVDLLRNLLIALRCVASQSKRILAQQILAKRGRAGVIQVLLAAVLRVLGFQRPDDGVLALIERGFAGFFLFQSDQHFVAVGRPIPLDLGILQPGAIHVLADLIQVRAW